MAILGLLDAKKTKPVSGALFGVFWSQVIAEQSASLNEKLSSFFWLIFGLSIQI